jgi:hypothetical protein
MAFYGSGIFYGSGAKYIGATSTAAQGIPIDLRFYRTSQDGIYVFWWGFDPAFITPALATAGFDLQLDTTPLFNSPNLVTFTQLTAITFQNGNVRKGFAVPVAARINATVQTWYAQVRTHTASFISAWSAPLTWTIPMSVQQSTAEALMESLPDAHVYGKGDLLKPVAQRKTNLWLIENMYGNQFDQIYYATYLTRTNNYVDLAVDEVLYQNFGVLFNFPKPISMQYVDYRWILMNLYLASLVGGTDEAIMLIVQAFTGVPPEITNIRDLNNFILNTVQDAPIIPIGSQSVFNTSSFFVPGTLVVQDLTTGLLIPSTDYTTDSVIGFWTMNTPTTHTLQATFDIGNPIKIFDALSGSTALNGLVTFTNGSTTLTGVGTLFLTQLTEGKEVTDPNGIYLGTISLIASNTSATLVLPWVGPTETVTAYVLEYTDIQLPIPVLWDINTLAWGVLITVFDPGEFILPLVSVLENLVNLLVPAAVKTYFEIEE